MQDQPKARGVKGDTGGGEVCEVGEVVGEPDECRQPHACSACLRSENGNEDVMCRVTPAQ